MTTPIDLSEMERLANAATPGAWRPDGPEYHFYGEHDGDYVNTSVVSAGEDRIGVVSPLFDGVERSEESYAAHAPRAEADIEFIAAADPQTVLALIDRVKGAEDAIAEMQCAKEADLGWFDFGGRIDRILATYQNGAGHDD